MIKHMIQASFPNLKIRPVDSYFQVTEQINDKAFHRNITREECIALIEKQEKGVIFTTEGDYHILSKNKILKKPPTKKAVNTSHNRQKNYILQEGIPLPFLIELGLMNAQGKVYTEKMAKFRQINRFLEMIGDVDVQNIVDFGCGKSYLTFALYYYLKFIKGLDIKMTGLDLKPDVIDFCSKLAKKLGYDDLNFCVGNIANYNPEGTIDMVVALHACDTATDAAISQAMSWKAKIILAAPCCQHELSKQIKSESLEGILQYGILKERFASIVLLTV